MLVYPSRSRAPLTPTTAFVAAIADRSPLNSPLSSSSSSDVIVVAGSPNPKRSRTGHLGESPVEEVDISRLEGSVASMVSSGGQASLTNPAEKAKPWTVEDLPLHEGRLVPANFNLQYHPVYVRLPEACMPTPGQRLVGNNNYTVFSTSKSAIQVQLAHTCLFVTKIGGKPWPKDQGSPNVSFTKFPNLEEAWACAVAKAGGWD